MADDDVAPKSDGCAEQASPQSLTADQVDRLLLSSKKIKNRNRKACYPCNRRKIKCDRDQNQPCTNCAKHSHPELCSWIAPDDLRPRNKRSAASRKSIDIQAESPQHGSSSSRSGVLPPLAPYPSAVTPSSPESRPSKYPRSDREPTIDKVVHDYQSPRQLTSYSTRPTTPKTPADIPNRSIASLVQDRVRHNQTHLAGVPLMLGVENQKASYLFIKASDTQERWRQLHAMLPSEKETLKYFGLFKTTALPFNALLIEPDEFEASVCQYVEDLGKRDPSLFESDRTVRWIGLLLAVLASGSQLSNAPLEERTNVSRDYARKSFHCLRLANFLLHPSEEVVQTLLLLSQVLQNDLQAPAAWSLLGTTIRLSQCLGLDIRHRKEHEKDILVPRFNKLWRGVMWQDTVLSLCLGRPPSALYRISISSPPKDSANLGYFDCMFCLCNIVMRIIDPMRPEHHHVTHALTDVREIDGVAFRGLVHLQNKDLCMSLKDRMEFYALRLHMSFTISYVCQMALRRVEDDPSQGPILLSKCKESLITSVRSFLSLSTLSIVPLRGWSYIHHALSSALLLGLMGETKSSNEVKTLQESLIKVLSQADGDAEPDGDGSTRFTSRHAKALEALQVMCTRASRAATPGLRAEEPQQESGNTSSFGNGDSVNQQPLQPMDSTLLYGGQWDVSQSEFIRSPNGTVVTPTTLWDSLFMEPPMAQDPGWTFQIPQGDGWGL